jgi:glycosyltransferase involved in cell wall biosynthesis/2-polyprenyl-3-methyl-5-hydroxy-6-metoxy-1,4-benzoquinol methylase
VAVTLSILISVYNEEEFITTLLDRVRTVPTAFFAGAQITHEVIVVDNGSVDGSYALVEAYAESHSDFPIRLLRLEKNQGKSGGIKTALAQAQGRFCLIQDADLEYSPADYPALLRPLLAGEADLVIGSRYLESRERRVHRFWHSRINRVFTLFTNIAADLDFTDMASAYKAFRTQLARSIPLGTHRFGIDAELPILFAKRRAQVVEVPVAYLGRSYDEGKKIRLADALALTWTILRAWMTNDLYVDKAAGAMRALESAARFNRWIADVISPFLGSTVLEIGAGIGNLTVLLCSGRREYIVTDSDGEYMELLRRLMGRRPKVRAAVCDPGNPIDFEPFRDRMESVVCLNVLEHMQDDAMALKNIYSTLKPGGRAVILVPQGAGAFGTLDRLLGHLRRYSKPDLEQKMTAAGFSVTRMIEFNRVAYPGWILNGRIFKRRSLGRLQLWALNLLIPIARRVDRFLPWPPTALIAVGVREK